MKKIILYIFAFFGLVFVLYLLSAFWSGFSSTVNPSAAFQRGKCVAECRKSNLSNNCENYCLEQTIKK
jgi:hypothetical protein